MPVYNVAPFVRRATESVLSQSWTDLELIIVDDGSTDGTAREIEEIDDPRVAFIQLEHGGVAQARNAAVSTAHGRYNRIFGWRRLVGARHSATSGGIS